MIDEIYDRAYRDGRDQFNAAAARAITGFGKLIHDAFEVLVGIEYSAPWAAKSKRVPCN